MELLQELVMGLEFLQNRDINTIGELVDYIDYLEDLKDEFELLKNEVTKLNNFKERLY